MLGVNPSQSVHPQNFRKPLCFLTFSRGIEIEHWLDMCSENYNLLQLLKSSRFRTSLWYLRNYKGS